MLLTIMIFTVLSFVWFFFVTLAMHNGLLRIAKATEIVAKNTEMPLAFDPRTGRPING